MTILAISLTILPTSPIPPTLLNQTLTTLVELYPDTRIFYGPSLSNLYEEAKILLATTTTENLTTATQTTILKSLEPLSPHLTHPLTLTPLPFRRHAFPLTLRTPKKQIPIDILHLNFPSPLPATTQHAITRTTSLLTLSIAEASKPGGLDDNPCLESLCIFTSEREGWIWAVWKDEGRREEWMRVGGGRGNLRVLMWEEFSEWKGGVGEFWDPVRWLGGGERGVVVEGGGFGFEEVVREGKGEEG